MKPSIDSTSVTSLVASYVPFLGSAAAGSLALLTALGYACVIQKTGDSMDKIIHASQKNPGLVLGVVVCTATTGGIAYCASRLLPAPKPPKALPDESTDEQIAAHAKEKEQYHSQVRMHTFMTTGFVVVISIVYVGGIYLAYKLADGQVKLTQLANEAKEAALKHGQATASLKATFVEAATCNSPSFALFVNDSTNVVHVQAQHIYGVGGGDFSPRSYEVYPGQFKVVAGNQHSWGAGAGVSVRTDDTAWKTVNHGQVVPLSKLQPVAGAGASSAQ